MKDTVDQDTKVLLTSPPSQEKTYINFTIVYCKSRVALLKFKLPEWKFDSAI